MKGLLRPALTLLLFFTVVLGLIYPLLITGISQLLMPYQANGSIIVRDGKAVGSALIGQQFDDPRYFWGRPSATSPEPYNAAASSGSNLGPSNPALYTAVQARINLLHSSDPANHDPIPVDLVTASGSGLDPEISVAAALWQIPRIAVARNLQEQQIRVLMENNVEAQFLGFVGEKRVNVLKLNVELDRISAEKAYNSSNH